MSGGMPPFSNSNTMRVYNLAKRFNTSYDDILDIIKQLGIQHNDTPLSKLTSEEVELITEFIQLTREDNDD